MIIQTPLSDHIAAIIVSCISIIVNAAIFTGKQANTKCWSQRTLDKYFQTGKALEQKLQVRVHTICV